MPDTRIVTVLKKLKGFTSPNTRAQFECWVGEGAYECIDYRPNFPNDNTDYALLDIDTVADGDTWVCTRWRDKVYAEIREQAEPPQQETLPESHDDGIDESGLVELLEAFRDFRYTPRGARYPYTLEGISVKLSPPRKNNCCTFVEALVIKAWLNHDPQFRWDGRGHADMMILGSDLFSPVTVLVERGVALPLNENAPPVPWCVVQGWASRTSGHTFIIVDYHADSDRVLTLESNSAYGLDGVGYRRLGQLRDHPPAQAPLRWWENPQAPTWRDICRWYPQRRLCALKINNPGWARASTEFSQRIG